MSGAFQTSREIFGSPIWKNIVDFRMFFLIYGNAVFSDEGVRLADDLDLKRGEWCRSTRKLQEDLQYIENRQIKTYSTSVVNRCIKRLVDMQMICTRTHQLGTVFTVVNYEKYQGLSNYKKDNLERNLEHSGNSGGTLGEHSGNNNKNVKNANKVKNEKKEVIKKEYAPYIFLTEDEHSKLTDLFSEDELQGWFLRYASWISGQSESVQKKRSAYFSILNWHRDEQKRPKQVFQPQLSSYQKTKSRLDQMLAEEEAKKNGARGYYPTGTDPFS
ncbi:hypothetical protein [Paenibacillus sp. NEAU-GSW1]|uniref:hypothetical protein n=1 Tax=Paenibacillus sp. NEAU-GSW1 TaxID=2682486 RepID=UPI0012E2AB52|nr:hypothetical protein [Paenibacillus sp. NEAU-GSW1]MUT66037.1 hypothetical protein [Paenibacillus sp. NEAU-GSW1]